MGYDKFIDEINYTISDAVNCYVITWDEGSFENILKLFENHMKQIKENISSDKAIIINCKSLSFPIEGVLP